jgi:arsenate reductase
MRAKRAELDRRGTRSQIAFQFQTVLVYAHKQGDPNAQQEGERATRSQSHAHRSPVKIFQRSSRNNLPQRKPQLPMITIYHNPRCSKSRAACELITSTYHSANEATEVVEYLKQPLSVTQLKALNAQLGCPVREMIRDTEAEYKELNLADPSLTDAQLYDALAKHPILLQRPIVVRNGRAVIGRPPENIAALFD